MGKQVFLSHSISDKDVAEKLRECLERHELNCWVAPRDIRPGCSWSNAIVEGIDASRMMVVILSTRSDASEHVKREVELCIGRSKPILPFVIEKFKPSPSMEYCLSHCQSLDATAGPISLHLDPLVRAVQRLLKAPNPVRVSAKARPISGRASLVLKHPAFSLVALLIFTLMITSVVQWITPGKTKTPLEAGAAGSDRSLQNSSPPTAVPAPTDYKSLAILSKLEERLSMNFPRDTPLEDVIKYIEQSTQDIEAGLPTGITILVDPQGLQDVDKTIASTVTLNIEGIPLRASLQLMLDQLGMTYVVKDGFLRIIAKESAP